MNELILVVDDDEDTRSLLSEGLRRRGFVVHAVDCAQACLDSLQGLAVDLVVTDVEMPGMSGTELCAILRDRHPHLPAIVVTGRSSSSTAAEVLENGAVAFLAKPVTIAALTTAIQQALCVSTRPPRITAGRPATIN